MSFLEFLDTLKNTLDDITVCGKENINRMFSIYMAIDGQRQAILSSMNKDGDNNGRQSDKHADPS